MLYTNHPLKREILRLNTLMVLYNRLFPILVLSKDTLKQIYDSSGSVAALRVAGPTRSVLGGTHVFAGPPVSGRRNLVCPDS